MAIVVFLNDLREGNWLALAGYRQEIPSTQLALQALMWMLKLDLNEVLAIIVQNSLT